MASITLLEPDVEARSFADGDFLAHEEFGRSVIDSVVHRKGLSLSLEVRSMGEMLDVSSRLERFLMVLAAASGGTSARVAPRFMDDTYPAMVSLTRRLPAGWSVEDERTVRFGRGRQVFVSVDRPVPHSGSASRPDRLIEIASAHRVDRDWFQSRVLPRISSEPGLTTVFYGLSDGADSLYSEIVERHARLQSADGEQRHFAPEIPSGADEWLPAALPRAV